MLLKFASMLLTKLFLSRKEKCKIRILANKIDNIYFKTRCCLAYLEFCHGVNKLVALFEFLEYHSLLVRQCQKVVFITLNKFFNILH